MRRRSFFVRVMGLVATTMLPLSTRGPETIRVLHRYDDGVRLVTGVVNRFPLPGALDGLYRTHGYVADVLSKASGNMLGVLTKTGRYIPWYDMP